MPNSPWQQVKDTAFVVMVMAAMAVTIIMTRWRPLHQRGIEN